LLQNFEIREELCEASKKMLAGTAGLEEGREAHHLDCMIMLDEVWNDLDVATIAWC